jgi:hypothetical protein
LDEVLESRFKVMSEIEKEKLQVAKAYNKRVGKCISDWRLGVEDNPAVRDARSQIQ